MAGDARGIDLALDERTLEVDLGTADPAILRLLDASMLDGQAGSDWVQDPGIRPTRRACALNLLASLRVTPSKATPQRCARTPAVTGGSPLTGDDARGHQQPRKPPGTSTPRPTPPFSSPRFPMGLAPQQRHRSRPLVPSTDFVKPHRSTWAASGGRIRSQACEGASRPRCRTAFGVVPKPSHGRCGPWDQK